MECTYTIYLFKTEGGYDVFEKNGTEYTKIAEVESNGVIRVGVEVGASKIFVAKAYLLNSEGQKLYSEYSNELVIDNTTLKTPILHESMGSGPSVPTMWSGFSVQNYVSTLGGGYSGFELYEKIDGQYTLISTEKLDVYVDMGESKTYVVKVYALNTKGEKIYSDYSNEVVVDNSKILAPTLTDVAGGVPGTEVMSRNLFINAEGNYVEEEALSAIDGFILYEKINGVYRVSCEVSGADRVGVDVPLGESKIYAVKVYVLDENGQKVYSDYSNEVVIDNTNMQ